MSDKFIAAITINDTNLKTKLSIDFAKIMVGTFCASTATGYRFLLFLAITDKHSCLFKLIFSEVTYLMPSN